MYCSWWKYQLVPVVSPCTWFTMRRWNFTVGDVELVLVEGEDEEQQQGGHSCNLFHELEWELHVDALLGLVYSTHRSVISIV